MKIALVHDQLYEFGGAERVFLIFCKMFPDADIFTAFYKKDRLKKYAPELLNRKIKTSFAQRIPLITKLYSPLRFLAPKIWERFNFSDYDLVISSSGWYMCKGITTNKSMSSRAKARDLDEEISHSAESNSANVRNDKQPVHISYIHHPPRYLYGYETAMEWQKHWPIKIYGIIINHFLRIWDYNSSQRPDYLIANSQETQRRIKKFYRRDSKMIYPPVKLSQNVKGKRQKEKQKENYYITVSRLQKAKHVDVLIQSANKLKFNLKIVGEGKERKYLESISGPTVEFLGRVNDEQLSQLYSNAKAFLFASVDEEFGIVAIEAMGHGLPVIAYASGGLLETIKDGFNGYLFKELTSISINQLIEKLERMSDDNYKKMSLNARTESEKYSEDIFKNNITDFIRNHMLSRT